MVTVEENTLDKVENRATWLKRTMTLSLSNENRARLQTFVNAIPEDLAINNFTKLFWFLFDGKTVDNSERLEYFINENEANLKQINKWSESNRTLIEDKKQLELENENLKETIKTLQVAKGTQKEIPELPIYKDAWFWQQLIS